MSILFSVVACETCILAKYASCDGNFTEIVNEVLCKIPLNNNKMTYVHGRYLFHYIIENKFIYFCVTEKTCQRSRAFLFLNEIQRKFLSNGTDFVSVLAEEMYKYSEDYSTITIRKGELDELNNIGVGCSESILGEKILLVHNSENLSFSTISYVSSTPHNIEKSSGRSKLGVIIFVVGLIIFLGLAICIFGPMSYSVIVLTGVLAYTFVSSTINHNLYKRKKV